MAQLVGVAETLTAEGADFVQSEQQQGDNECRVIPVLIKRYIYISYSTLLEVVSGLMTWQAFVQWEEMQQSSTMQQIAFAAAGGQGWKSSKMVGISLELW